MSLSLRFLLVPTIVCLSLPFSTQKLLAQQTQNGSHQQIDLHADGQPGFFVDNTKTTRTNDLHQTPVKSTNGKHEIDLHADGRNGFW
jgi:hypothetical protein